MNSQPLSSSWSNLFAEQTSDPFEAFLTQQKEPWRVLDTLPSQLESLGSSQSLSDLQARYPGVTFAPDGWYALAEDVRIEPGVYLSGWIVARSGAESRHGAYLRSAVYLGKGAVVGHASEIKNSILLGHATAAHFNYVGDSIVGERVNLGAGAICANLRLDEAPVRLRWCEQIIHTGSRKLGALIGADCQVGCHAVLSPGTILGRGVWVGPGCSIRGTVDAGTRLLGQERAYVTS